MLKVEIEKKKSMRPRLLYKSKLKKNHETQFLKR